MAQKKSRRAATVARIERVRRPAPKKPRRPPSARSDGEIHPKGVLRESFDARPEFGLAARRADRSRMHEAFR